jgi:hypothetical protein
MPSAVHYKRYKERLIADPVWHRKVLAKNAASNAAAERKLRSSPEGWALANWRSIKKRCRKYNIPFNLEVCDLAVPPCCPVLGVAFTFGGGRRCPTSPSVDRIRPSLGYVRGNTCVISWRANRLKSDSVDPAELRAIARYMELML